MFRALKPAVPFFTRARRLRRDEGGFSIVEGLVAIAILGTILTGFMVAMGTGSLAVRVLDVETAVQRLASNQLEYTKSYTFDAGAVTYPAVETPDGYSVSVVVTPVADSDDHLQKITVTVSHQSGAVFTVDDYKVDR